MTNSTPGYLETQKTNAEVVKGAIEDIATVVAGYVGAGQENLEPLEKYLNNIALTINLGTAALDTYNGNYVDASRTIIGSLVGLFADQAVKGALISAIQMAASTYTGITSAVADGVTAGTLAAGVGAEDAAIIGTAVEPGGGTVAGGAVGGVLGFLVGFTSAVGGSYISDQVAKWGVTNLQEVSSLLNSGGSSVTNYMDSVGEIAVTSAFYTGDITEDYSLSLGGALIPSYSGAITTSENFLSQISDIPSDTASSSATNTYLSQVSVVDFAGLALGQSPFTSDPTGAVAGGALIATADAEAILPDVNNNGIFNNSPSAIAGGDYRPGNQQLLPSSQNFGDLTEGQNLALLWQIFREQTPAAMRAVGRVCLIDR